MYYFSIIALSIILSYIFLLLRSKQAISKKYQGQKYTYCITITSHHGEQFTTQLFSNNPNCSKNSLINKLTDKKTNELVFTSNEIVTYISKSDIARFQISVTQKPDSQ